MRTGLIVVVCGALLVFLSLTVIRTTRHCGHSATLWEAIDPFRSHCCKAGRRLARLRQTRLALKMYRLDHDAYPPSLDALTEHDYIGEIDGSLIYETRDSGYTLASHPQAGFTDISYLITPDGTVRYNPDGAATEDSPLLP